MNGHHVQFYQSDDFLCDIVGDFVSDGLTAGDSIVLIVRHDRRDELARRINRAGFDFDSEIGNGRVIYLDAHEALTRFMVDQTPDAARFEDVIGGVIASTSRGTARRPVRAFGEMVDVLWSAGNQDGALQLEVLWNQLAQKQAFSLLCGYGLKNFQTEQDRARLHDVCAQHHHVFPAESYSRVLGADAQVREIVFLQQREIALEKEIARRQQLEEALRSSLKVKSDFLAVMSHELRTPLNAVMGYHDLLAHEVGGPLTLAQRRYLDRIKDGTEHLIRLVDQLLSLSLAESETERIVLEDVNVARVVSQACALVNPIAARKGLAIAIDVPASIVCRTDAHKLQHVLLNLLSNAVKFTITGGVMVKAEEDGERVRLSVRDTGIGISRKDAERIFEPFVQADATATRAYGGAGIGLAVSRQLIRLLRGELALQSEPGHGSVFTITLPTDYSAAPIPAALPVAHPQAKL